MSFVGPLDVRSNTEDVVKIGIEEGEGHGYQKSGGEIFSVG